MFIVLITYNYFYLLDLSLNVMHIKFYTCFKNLYIQQNLSNSSWRVQLKNVARVQKKKFQNHIKKTLKKHLLPL